MMWRIFNTYEDAQAWLTWARPLPMPEGTITWKNTRVKRKRR